MNNIIALACLGLLTTAFVGCSDSESSAPAAANIDRDRQRTEDVIKFERSQGKDHGYTDEEMQEIMKELEASPVFKNKFLGIPTIQNPSDAWIVMEIMYETKPDLIVETGTHKGGSATLWAIVLEHINPDGRVVTIDIEDKRGKRSTSLRINQEKVTFLLGSSTDPKIVADVHRRAEGKQVLVILDSLHSKDHVMDELEAYAPLVSVGGYIIVQDTTVGPLGAIDEFLAATDSFVADRSKERYPDTSSVRGFLKRVKP